MKIDLGCGKNKAADFIGVDSIKFDGVDVVADLKQKWPFEDNSVDEARTSHFVEHLTGAERIHFFNELYRVLKKDAPCLIIVPHWSNDCAYGDPTHQWPPISEWFFFYLEQKWREANAPHTEYKCNFDWTYGYSLEQDAQTRNPEFQRFGVRHYRNVIREIIGTITKRELKE